jgi:hypothetical protein
VARFPHHAAVAAGQGPEGLCGGAFVKAVKEGWAVADPCDELVEVTRVSFEVAEAVSGRG